MLTYDTQLHDYINTKEVLNTLLLFPLLFNEPLHSFLSSPGHSHGTCRCERTTLTCGLTLSLRVTAQTHASTYPSLKRPAVATWSKWEAKSKPGRNAGSSLTATGAHSPTMQVGQQRHMQAQKPPHKDANALIEIHRQQGLCVHIHKGTHIYFTYIFKSSMFCIFNVLHAFKI